MPNETIKNLHSPLEFESNNNYSLSVSIFVKKNLNTENQPFDPVNIRSSVTSSDSTALLWPVAA